MLDPFAGARGGASRLIAGVIVVLFASKLGAEQVEKSTRASLADGPLQAYSGLVDLPSDGVWTVQTPKGETGIRELYLLPTQPARLRQLGQRMYAALEESQTQSGRWQVQRGFEACRQFAQENQGIGPASINDFKGDKRWEYLTKQWDVVNWRNSEVADYIDERPLKGPFIHLIPNAKFAFAPIEATATPQGGTARNEATEPSKVRRTVPESQRAILAFELRPFVDDDKHWVLFTDGACERKDIDSELVASCGVKIRPVMAKGQFAAARRPVIQYQVVLVTDQSTMTDLELVASNVVLDRETKIQWNTSKASSGASDEMQSIVDKARKFAWAPYALAGNGGILDVWNRMDRSGRIATDRNANNRNPRRNLSMFSILGGRAAVEETLQLQNIAVAETDESETVDIDSLTGVKVKSHPFEEMLAGQTGGQLELARSVPADRFFIYVGKPETLRRCSIRAHRLSPASVRR